MFVLTSSTILSETFLILRRIRRDVIRNVHLSSCKVLVVLVRFEYTCLTDFRKIFKRPVSNNSVQLEPSYSERTEGLTVRQT
jgi:hypothetical protein